MIALPEKQAGPGRSRAQDIDRHVGARMRERRIMLGLTQQQMAELIGVTYQQAHKYEKGINRIGAGRLFEIARILGVPIYYFYEGVTDAEGEEANGFADDSSPQMMEFVSSGEGLQLSLAYMKIRDAKVRKRVLDLVKSLGEDEGETSGNS